MADFKTVSNYLIKKKQEEEKEKKAAASQTTGTSSSDTGSTGSAGSKNTGGRASLNSSFARKRGIQNATSEKMKESRDAILNRAKADGIAPYRSSGFAALDEKRRQQEEQEREVLRLAAEQLKQNVGWKKTGNTAVYATPNSPLPDTKQSIHLKDGRTETLTGSRAKVPGAYGIAPGAYVQAMRAIDQYNQKPELNAESKAFLQKYFPDKQGELPTDEELNARTAGMEQLEGEAYGRSVKALKDDWAAVQEARKAYENQPKATDGVLSDETRAFLQENFGEKYERGELPTADELESWAAGQALDRETLEWLYGASDEIQKVQASHDALMEGSAKAAYDEAVKLLGADAEQYAGKNAAEYYERYGGGELYGADNDVREFKPDYSDRYGWFKAGPSEAEMTTEAVLNKGRYTHVSPELVSGDILALQNMTDEQRETYLYLASEYGEDTAYDYFQELLTGPQGFNAQAWMERDKAIRQNTNDNWLLETGKTFLTAPAQAAGGAYALGQYLKGEEIDPYNNMFVPGQMTQTPRSEATERFTRKYGTTDEEGNPKDTLKSWLINAGYQAAVSGIDSQLAGRLTFGVSPLAGSLMQGAWSVGGTVQDVKMRGGSDEQAMLLGGIDMLIETATEYIPMEQLLESMNGKDVKKVVDILRRGLSGALSEAPGEAASAALGWISDDAVMGAMSNWDALVKEKGKTGALLDVVGEVFTEGFIGGLSGAGSNINEAAGAYVRNKRIENYAKRQDQLQPKTAQQTQEAGKAPEDGDVLADAARARAEQMLAEQQTNAQELDGLGYDMPVVEAYEGADNATVREESRERSAEEAERRSEDRAAEELTNGSGAQAAAAENATTTQRPAPAVDAGNEEVRAESRERAAAEAERKNETAPKAAQDEPAKLQGKTNALIEREQNGVVYNEEGRGQGVRVTGIDHVEDGDVYVRVADGSGKEYVVNQKEMDFTGDMGELLASEDAGRMDVRAVAASVNEYDGSQATPEQYMRAFAGVYERARAGMDYRQAVTNSALAQSYLTQQAAAAAYLTGTARRNAEQGMKLTARQKMQNPVLNALNKLSGDKIRMVEDAPYNAMYNPKTGEIYISKNAEKGAYAYYAMHELIHKMKAEKNEHWNRFSEMVIDELLVRDVDIDAEMAKVRERYAQKGVQLDADAALEEVIANNAPAMLQDRAVLEKLVAKDRTLMEKVRAWFESFMDKLHSAMVESGNAMAELESWRNMELLKDDAGELMKMYDCLVEALDGTKGEQKQAGSDTNVVKLSAKEREHYDYSKTFIEQMRDLQNGKMNGRDSLLIGRTPKVLQDIGLSDLPLMINQTHARYLYEGKLSSKNDDHILSWKTIERLPSLMANPVAVIASDNPAHQTDSVNVIVEATSKNEEQGFAAIRVNGTANSNRREVDANLVSTVFGNKKAADMLYDAIVDNVSGGTELYYIDKKRPNRYLRRSAINRLSGSFGMASTGD